MNGGRRYPIYPAIGNSPRVNDLNFFSWSVSFGSDVSISAVTRKRGSAIGQHAPALSLLIPAAHDLDVRWLGDALVAYTAEGDGSRPFMACVALDDLLVVDVFGAVLSSDNGQEKPVVVMMDSGQKPAQEPAVRSLSQVFTTEKKHSSVGLRANTRAAIAAASGARRLRLALCPGGSRACLEDAMLLDIGQPLERSTLWAKQKPAVLGPECMARPLDHLWTLHRISAFEPVGNLTGVWETPGRGYLFHYFGHWDAVHAILDIAWGDAGRAEDQLRNILSLLDADGRVGVRFDPEPTSIVHPLAQGGRSRTTPPLWSQAALEIVRRTGNTDLLTECYEAFQRNIAWFERQRRFAGTSLFFHTHADETGYDNMPREGFGSLPEMETFSDYAAVDLTSQMASYYADMAVMASELSKRDEAARWRDRCETTAEAVRAFLWDEEAGFFFDRNMQTGELSSTRTLAGFWPLICGVADDRQAAYLVEHLQDSESFRSRYPVPSVAMNERAFCLDCWSGPVWVSQNMWIIRGLQSYGLLDLAAEVALKSLEMVDELLAVDGCVYEFYHPLESSVKGLTRKGDRSGPCSYYAGHNPVFALALGGVFGIRCGEQGLEICPRWNYLPLNWQVSFVFGRPSENGAEGSVAIKGSQRGNGLWKLLIDGKECFCGSEDAPAVIDYGRIRYGAHRFEAVRM